MPFRWLVLFSAILLAEMVCAVDPPALSDGITAVCVGDFVQATQLLQPLVASHPDDSVTNYWLGRAYYEQRQFRAAAKCLAVAVNYDGDNPDACLWYARALRAAGKGKDAAEAYASLLQRFPADSTNLAVMAEYAAAQALAGNYAGARTTFRQLLSLNPSLEDRTAIAAWNKALDGLSRRAQLEPAAHLNTGQFQICYDEDDDAVSQVRSTIEHTITRTKNLTGIQLQGFRVLLFPTWASYSRYAMILLPKGAQLRSAAFTLPGLLVLWSPSDWPVRPTVSNEFSVIIRHELVHLALYQHTGCNGFPMWLNEGIACYFGGWGGMQSGKIPAQPRSLNELDAAFMKGTLDAQEQAYAQAHAMVTVLAYKLGTPALLQFVDKIVDGIPIATAYEQLSNEKFDAFLSSWPGQFAVLANTPVAHKDSTAQLAR